MFQTVESAGCVSTLPSPEQSDAALLNEYASTRNPTLFSELARRYTGSVYGTCLRITASSHDAEEVTQDCFFELAKQATSIHTSVAGWLHRMATNRSLNKIRSKKRRKKHEVTVDTEVSAAVSREVTDPSWADVAPILDEVINSLPDELRGPVVQHYLNGDSQSHIAEQLNVNQSTVSRRINQGLETLRTQLQKRGVTLGLSSLMLLISENSAEASPHLVGSVSKIGLLAGSGKAVGGTAATFGAWAKLSAMVGTPVFMQIVVGGVLPYVTTLAMFLYIVIRKPDWFIQQILASGGRAEYFSDFPVFERWTWETPPPYARRVMRGGFMVFAFTLAMASLFLFFDNSVMRFGGAAGPLVLGLWRLAVSVRIMVRLRRLPASNVEAPKEEVEPVTLVDLLTAVGSIISVFLFVTWSAVMAVATAQSFFFWFAVLSGIGIALGLCELVWKYGIYMQEGGKESTKPITEEMAQASAATAKTMLRVASFFAGGTVIWMVNVSVGNETTCCPVRCGGIPEYSENAFSHLDSLWCGDFSVFSLLGHTLFSISRLDYRRASKAIETAGRIAWR